MCTRLCYNFSQNLLVFFLIFTLKVQEPSRDVNLSLYLAIFPLIIYLSSCIGSFYSGILFKKFGRKNTFALGTLNLFISALVMSVIMNKFVKLRFFLVFDSGNILFLLYHRSALWCGTVFKHECRIRFHRKSFVKIISFNGFFKGRSHWEKRIGRSHCIWTLQLS